MILYVVMNILMTKNLQQRDVVLSNRQTQIYEDTWSRLVRIKLNKRLSCSHLHLFLQLFVVVILSTERPYKAMGLAPLSEGFLMYLYVADPFLGILAHFVPINRGPHKRRPLYFFYQSGFLGYYTMQLTNRSTYLTQRILF